MRICWPLGVTINMPSPAKDRLTYAQANCQQDTYVQAGDRQQVRGASRSEVIPKVGGQAISNA